MFTVHTQASYVLEDQNAVIPSYLIRLSQLSESKRFIEKKLDQFQNPNDLNIFLGDFNVNARDVDYPFEKVLNSIENDDIIRNHIDNLKPTEYDLMMFILNNPNSQYKAIDCMFERFKEFKVTFGNYTPDRNPQFVD